MMLAHAQANVPVVEKLRLELGALDLGSPTARFSPGGVGVPCFVSSGITSPAYRYVVGGVQVPLAPG